MGYWEFDQANPSSVRMEVTQGDQFNNDEVGLAEALVREAIQNSSDASCNDLPVKVRFAIREVSGEDARRLATQLHGLRPHLDECGIDTGPIDLAPVRVLAIEDFNTKGLTGSRTDIDKGNFDRFWRAVGDSGKKGKEGGRWGLGKLVYSSASALKVFYGLTVTESDPEPCLLGQTVLVNHRIGNNFHPAHGFYFEGRSEPLDLQMPIRSDDELDFFRRIGSLSRTSQTGLSILVPWLLDGIDEESIIAGVITNYYFPILAGKLVVEVGDNIINRDTFLDIAASHQPVHNIPFDFVKSISETITTDAEITSRQPIGNGDLQEDYFSPEDVSAMKERFASGQIVRVRVPVILRPKGETDRTSHIDLYLQGLPEGEKPYALIARGPITLPGERRYFGAAAAYGALIANDDDIADFLGDAENPAHTAWNTKAHKLAERWRNPAQTLATVRHALRHFYTVIADQAESEDTEALIDIFSILDQTQSSRGPRRKSRKPKPVIEGRVKAISIRPRKSGFDLVPGPGVADWEFPKTIRIRVAYDMIGANPFKMHSPFDFDFATDNEITVEGDNVQFEPLKSNILKVVAESEDFRLEVRGFDEHRDIIVDARAQ
jgi:hypothetical protein